jgi:hypothetical protein
LCGQNRIKALYIAFFSKKTPPPHPSNLALNCCVSTANIVFKQPRARIFKPQFTEARSFLDWRSVITKKAWVGLPDSAGNLLDISEDHIAEAKVLFAIVEPKTPRYRLNYH